MDKIAEHIAKFNAPEGSDFFWVSDLSLDNCEEYKREVKLSNLVLKVADHKWKYYNEQDKSVRYLTGDFSYTLKHEQKGEQMKSIELSEEENKPKYYRRGGPILKDGQVVPLNDILKLLNRNDYDDGFKDGIAENAKPIPTEPRFSMNDILKEASILYKEGSIHASFGEDLSLIFRSLKTPKPRLRDRNHSEVVEWLKQQRHFRFFQFSMDERGGIFRDALQYVLFQDEPYPFYRIDQDSPWLPIPPIEIESEK